MNLSVCIIDCVHAKVYVCVCTVCTVYWQYVSLLVFFSNDVGTCVCMYRVCNVCICSM